MKVQKQQLTTVLFHQISSNISKTKIKMYKDDLKYKDLLLFYRTLLKKYIDLYLNIISCIVVNDK